VAAAKVVADFAKTNDKLVIRGGVYGGKALDANGVKQLASIPSKEVLLAQLCGLLMSPDLPHRRGAGRAGGQEGRRRSGRCLNRARLIGNPYCFLGNENGIR
jgi:hypothetical protein